VLRTLLDLNLYIFIFSFSAVPFLTSFINIITQSMYSPEFCELS
jgi:hypothetical protein